ncbi:hypothetical protein [Escherichia coli]|uniref:hypothetical protein n=1 Tax=Escherichia coli TaxID=562 RepID=UPI00388FB9D8
MASTEEKLLTLLLSVEHLQHTAMEQQKAVADSLAVARETLRGYRDISDGVAKQVRDEVRNEVQKLDVAGLIGERISQDFQRLEESVANMKANADALNRDIATIHSNIVQEYNTLKGYSWKWLGGVSVAFLVMFCVLAKWHLNRSQFGIRIDHDLASISDHSLASQSITIWHASDH